MTPQQKEARLLWLADGFDTYLATGRAPEGTEADDMLAQYVRDVVDRTPGLGGDAPEFRHSLKDSLQAFLGEMIDRFEAVDRDGEPEQMLFNKFMSGTPGERRRLWKQVCDFTRRTYSPAEVATDGYESQLDAANESVVHDMMARQWQQAMQHRRQRVKRNILSAAAKEWEKNCARQCRDDYEAKRSVARVTGSYPVIDEIAAVVGQHRPEATAEVTRLAQHYLPSMVSATAAATEVDLITTGRDLKRVIPTEYSLLASGVTEPVFLYRYADGRLQQFASPAADSAVKAPQSTVMPRMTHGPIIVSLDTSSSMDGRAADISRAMLYRLLEIAREERRPCYLITYAVRSRSVDLTEPGQWRKVDEFLSRSFTGGTNGEQMLRDAIARLHTATYRMADVLIISDFAFARPIPSTLAAIRKEQAADTRFYGLQIGTMLNPYSSILDRIWTVQ